MIEELSTDIYQIEVPLPGNPLKSLNAYLIRSGAGFGSQGRHLLIDNGFNHPTCRKVLCDALDSLAVRRWDLDFFISHLHADHCGLTEHLREHPDAKVWCSAGDGVHINMLPLGSPRWSDYLADMLPQGMPQAEVQALERSHPAMRYAVQRPLPFSPCWEGDVLEYGAYSLQVISVPGHTPDHLCLYEPHRKMLFSGDHILGDISPNIARWRTVRDALGDYLHSLQKIVPMDVALCLPGHRTLFADTVGRIHALQAHHEARLGETLRIIAEGELCAYAVAGQMRWALRAASWEDFPVAQKYFACGEALAHLDHLVATGKARTRIHDGTTTFSLV